MGITKIKYSINATKLKFIYATKIKDINYATKIKYSINAIYRLY